MSTTTAARPVVPAGMETKAATTAPAAKASSSVLVGHEDTTGVVEAFVSITGVVDEVNDIIVPGAYAETLVKRKPKGVFSHDWNRWVARTEVIEEWLPGDPRITQALTKAGRDPLPKEAGVLYVKTKFNLRTDEGRNAYENVVFFSETGECEWSIGYLVPAGKSSRDKAGTRYIKALDLYEYSPVLFGAAPLSGTLAVKSLMHARGATGSESVPTAPLRDVLAALGRKGAAGEVDEEQALADLHAAAEAEIDWEAVDAATASLESKYLALSVKAKDSAPGDGNAENLRRWYVAGAGAAKIRWGTDGDLTRCHRIAAKHMTSDRAWGYCQLRHRDATGEFNPESAGAKGLPAVEPRSALLDAYDPTVERKAGVMRAQDETPPVPGMRPVDDGLAGGSDALADEPGDEVLESKAYPHLAGSYEERHAAIRTALHEALMGDVVERDGAMVPSGGIVREWDYVEIVATYPDRVIARRSRWGSGGGGEAEETWEVGYEFDGDDVVLAEPEQVRLEVRASVERGDMGVSEVPEAVFAGIDAVTIGVKGLTDVALEAKAGRVLSASNEARLRQAVEHLVHVLRGAGVPIHPNGSDTDTRWDGTVDTTAPAGMAPMPPVDSKGMLPPPNIVAAGLGAFLDSLDDDDDPVG